MLNFLQEVTDIYGVIYVLLIVIIFNLISLIIVKIKGRRILANKRTHILRYPRHLGEYLNKLESKLLNLNYPYGLTKKRYLIIKYFFPIIIFLISFVNYKTLKVPMILSLFIFFIPDYLVQSFIKKEKYILISELDGVVSSLILSLTAFSTLSQALEIAGKNIKYKRLKNAYDIFVKTYIMNGYVLKRPAETLKNKFNSYELTLFLTTLLQGEKEGELIDVMTRCKEVLEMNYFKYLKRRATLKTLYVTLGTVVALINLALIVMYPIIMQVLDNLRLIFA